MVGLVHFRIREEKKQNRLYWGIVFACWMYISIVYNTIVVKHFVDECVGSIILGVIEIFVSIRKFWLKKRYKEIHY